MTETDPLSSILEEIRERNMALRTRYGYVGGLLVLAKAENDVPRLLAALEAVLKLADEAIPAVGTAPPDCTDACDTGPCNCSGESRDVAWTLDPAAVRKAIIRELSGEESRDGQ
jgi:hypothetical protein